MELKQLQFFVVSVDMGSFKKAAEVLYTTQPHISKTIKALEQELQTELFNRNASGVTMTEEGKQVYAYASSILQQVDVIEKVGEKKNSRTLYISSVPSSRLASLFARFCQLKKDEDIRYQFMEGTVEEIMWHMHHRTSEIGFVCISQRQLSGFIHQLEHKRLEFHLLKKTEPCLFVGRQSPLYEAGTIDPAALASVKLVQFQEDFYSISSHPGHLKEDFPIDQADQTAVVTNSDNVVMSLLEHTEFGNVSSRIAGDISRMGQLREIPLTDAADSISFGYIKRKQGELSSLAAEYIRFVKNEL